MVFGISLAKCLENDRLMMMQRSPSLPASAVRSCAASGNEASYGVHVDAACRSDSRSSRTSAGRPPEQTDEASKELLQLSYATTVDRSMSLTSDVETCATNVSSAPLVPRLVTCCIEHITAHGLNTIGIFRVSSSKKRSRQLREEFDTGVDVILSDHCCPHDVATLLKEFFRDMSEPLLPHQLYQPFLATQRVRNRRRQFEMLQQLMWMLPAANRDTLQALLVFLKTVAEHSSDRRTSTGDWITGNRMDSSNLATLFAPNVLHSWCQNAQSAAAAADLTAERIDAINTLRSLIDHNNKLFEVPSENLHAVYLSMQEQCADILDMLLTRRLHAVADK